jgi:glutamate dehydrogenase
MSESTAEVAHTLLAEAAKAAEAAGADSIGVGDLKRYLEAYYRHVPPEDLLPAGPQRAGAVAAEHARVAARRPQGRALVRVRAAGESAALEDSRGVVDIVTDDMPFLVDSITNELARHNLDSYHIVHPQLVVRRDVSGELREVVGPPGEDSRGHDEITESWMHIEIDSAGDDVAGLEDDLRRVLADVRVAVEDHSKMQGQALRVATQLGTEGARAPAETQALLRWLADNHFTFLGYREYNLVEGPDGMALQAVPGTGLGILRHDKPGASSFAALPPEVRARAKDPQRLILTKANSRSTVHRRSYLDYIAVKRIDAIG